MKKLSTTVLLLAVAISATDARACGEVMYRMGGALRYHAFITRHPAQILLYSGPASREANTDRDAFHHNLEKAGHSVTVVDTPEALGQALGAHSYDVIITYAADLPAIEPALAHVSNEPTLIPVFQRNSESAVKSQYPLALNEDANLNQFLKTIEQTMKARGGA
jgi:hypothetical protein